MHEQEPQPPLLVRQTSAGIAASHAHARGSETWYTACALAPWQETPKFELLGQAAGYQIRRYVSCFELGFCRHV